LRTHGDEWTRYRAQVPRWLGAPRSAAARRTLAWLAAGAAMSVGTPVYLAFAHGLEGYLLHPTLILAQAAPYLVAGAFWLPCRTPPLPRAGTWTAIVMFAAALVIYVPMLTGIVSTGGDMVALAFMAIDAVTLAVLVLSIVLVHAVVFVRRRGRLPASRSR
jgi:hypothetical protein